jgi:signal transduction histidine kinase
VTDADKHVIVQTETGYGAHRLLQSGYRLTVAAGRIMVLPSDSDEQQLLLATLPPSKGQIRLAIGVVAALLLAFVLTVPFTNIQLPRVDAFIPAFETAIVFNDLVTAALLYAQFSIMRSRALLVLASGFLYTALIVIPHALTFPGAFAPSGLLGAGLQTTAWLYYFWHIGSPVAVIAYVLLKDEDAKAGRTESSSAAIVGWSVALVISMVCVLTWVAIEADALLPRIMAGTIEANRNVLLLIGAVTASLNAVALVLLWVRRRSVLDLWLIVMCCAWLAETVVTATVTGRFTFGYYASRLYAFVAVFSVLLVLLSETMALYSNLVYSTLRRRSNREGRKIAMDAMAASIAHEVTQPIAAMTNNSHAALILLARAPPDIDEARAALDAVVSDGDRASAVIASLRAMFKRDTTQRARINANELVQEVLKLVDADLRSRQVTVSTELREGLPQLFADRAQLQQVFLNLFMNAIEAMRSVTDGVRLLRIKSDFIQEHSGILVTVEDSGPGIDSKDKARILEPFFSTKPTGTGIGLAICQSIIESHGGHIRVSDNHPRGAIFHVALPDGET